MAKTNSHQYLSNSLDTLSTALIFAIAKTPKKSILQPTTILIPSNEISSWLTLKLANSDEASNICAGIKYAFPANFFWEITQLLIPEVPANSPFAFNNLRWYIWQILIAHKNNPSTEITDEINAWLSQNNPLAIFQFAEEVAKCFSNYRLYWEELLDSWQKNKLLDLGKDEIWQGELWREINNRLFINNSSGNHEVSNPIYQWVEVLENPNHPLHNRYCQSLQNKYSNGIHGVFGIPLSQMSWQYHRALQALSKVVETVWWQYLPITDITTAYPWDKKLQKIYPESSNLDSYINLSSNIENETSLLQTLKNHWTGAQVNFTNQATSDSLQIGAFSSLSQEVEYWAEFIYQKTLKSNYSSGDIVILTPNLENYEGIIQSIFSSHNPPLPFYSQNKTPALLSLFWQRVITIFNSDFSAQNFYELISHPYVCISHKFSEKDIKTIFYELRKINWKIGNTGDKEQLAIYPDALINGYESAILRLQALNLQHTNPQIDLIINLSRAVFELSNFAKAEHTLGQWVYETGKKLLLLIPDKHHHWQKLSNDLLLSNNNAKKLSFNKNLWEKLLTEQTKKISQGSKANDKFNNDGGTIKILPFMSDHIIPAKITIVMGLSGSEYPQTIPKSTFDLTNEINFSKETSKKSSYINDPQDERFLALIQTIQCSHEFAGFSYVRGRDESPATPAFVIRDLKEHLRSLDINIKNISINPESIINKTRPNNFTLPVNNYKKLWAITDSNTQVSGEVVKVNLHDIQKTLCDPVSSFIHKKLARGNLFVDSIISSLPNEGDDRYQYSYTINDCLANFAKDNLTQIADTHECINIFCKTLIAQGKLPFDYVGEKYKEKLITSIDKINIDLQKIDEQAQVNKITTQEIKISFNQIDVEGSYLQMKLASKNYAIKAFEDMEAKNKWTFWIQHILLNYFEPTISLAINLKEQKIVKLNAKDIKAENKKIAEEIIELWLECNRRLIPFHPEIAKKAMSKNGVELNEGLWTHAIKQSNKDSALALVWQEGFRSNEVLCEAESLINKYWTILNEDFKN